MPGPPPKRQDQRRRVNKDPMGVTTAEGAAEVVIPPSRPWWHDTARHWYESLAESGQSAFYEPSDWALALFCADMMTQTLNGKASAVLVQQVTHMMGELLTSEGSRRRLRLELARRGEPIVDKDDEAADAAVSQWTGQLGIVG